MAESNVYQIIQGIKQAAANAFDGAKDKDGEEIDIGLKRDEGDKIKDSRVMDGFGVTVGPNKVTISYQAEIQLKDVHDKSFEGDIEDMIEKVASFLKKEYKKLTGSALKLNGKKKSFQAIVQYVSKVRVFVLAKKDYDIPGMKVDGLTNEPHEVDKKFQKFLDQGGFGSDKKVDNVEGKGGKDRNKKPEDEKLVKVLGDK